METANVYMAFFAGVVSVFSPCVLPVLPTYGALLTSSAIAADDKQAQPSTVLLRVSLFFLGFCLVFIIMGATASLAGQVFLKYQNGIREMSAIIMMVLGLQLMGILRISLLAREYRPWLSGTFQGPVGAFILGVAFTTGWTPCVGPILSTILLYAGTTATLHTGIVLLLAYAIGFAGPFLALAIVCHRYYTRMRCPYLLIVWLQKAAGLVILLIGLGIYFNWLQVIPGLWY